MQKTAHKSFEQPEETREFPNGEAQIVSIDGAQVGRMIFQPGWRWSNDVKPIAATDSCEAPHFQYHVSGRLAIRMDDGHGDGRGTRRCHLAAQRTRRVGRGRRARSCRRLVRGEQLRQGELKPSRG
jgi:hypothetical protein